MTLATGVRVRPWRREPLGACVLAWIWLSGSPVASAGERDAPRTSAPGSSACLDADREYEQILRAVSLPLIFAGAPLDLIPSLQRQRAELAVALYGKCLSAEATGPLTADRHLRAAHLALITGDLTAAVDRARQAHALASSDESATTLARLLAYGGQLDEALEFMRDELKQRPRSAALRREVALLLDTMGRSFDKIPLYLGTLEEHPADPLALCDAAVVVFLPLQRIDEAMELVRRAVAPALEEPGAAGPLEIAVVTLARALGPMQRPADAIALLEEVLESHPNLRGARRELGLLQRRFGLPGQAEATYETALARTDDNTLRLLLATDVYAFTGKLDKALANLDYVYAGGHYDPRLLGDLDRGYAMLASGFAYAGRLEFAVRLYSALLARTPEFLEVRDALARIQLERQDTEAALDTYRSYLEKNPTDAVTRARFATSILLGLGKLDEATAELRRVLREHPDNGVQRVNLAWTLERQRKLPEALLEMREAMKRIPENPMCIEKFVDLLDLTGAHDEANIWRDRAQRLAGAYRRLEGR